MQRPNWNPSKQFPNNRPSHLFCENNIYEKSKPNECFLEFLEESMKPFSSEIEKFIAIAYQNLQVVSIHRTVQYLNLVHPQSLSLLVMFWSFLILIATPWISWILICSNSQSCSGKKCLVHQLRPCNIWQRKPDNSITTKWD